MKILILYSVACSVIWVVAGVVGLGIGSVLFASVVGPPVFHVMYVIGRMRGYY